MSRITPLTPDSMNQQQLAIWQEIVFSRGGNGGGPFQVWLHNPELAQDAQRLGALVRYRTSLPPRLSELAILTCAQRWRCVTEWRLHEPFALQAGLDPSVIQALEQGRQPEFEKADEKAVHAFCASVLAQGNAVDGVYQRCSQVLGQTGMVELTAILGYYTLVAFSLNVFQVEPPAKV